MVAPQPFFRPRGTPFSVLHRIRALVMLGHTVELLTYPFGSSPDIAGLTIHRSSRVPGVRDVAIGPSAAKLLLDIPLFRQAAVMARSGRFDLLHTHEEAGWLGAWLRRHSGLPHLYDMHSSLPQQLENFGRFNWPPVAATFRRLEQFTLDGSDGVIAICQELYDQVLSTGYRRPLAMIENTLDFPPVERPADDEEVLRRSLDLGDAPAIVYTGTVEKYQGLDLLLAAAPAVLARCPAAIFVLVGGSAAQWEPLAAMARAAGIAAAFRFVPAVPPEEVVRYLRLADVLVTTRARGTNTPLKIYQYLRASRPIVATAIRSHTQVLDGDTAELVPPDAAGIAEGLVHVLLHPERARQLASRAGEVSRERYGEEAYLGKLKGLLDRLPPACTRAAADDGRLAAGR